MADLAEKGVGQADGVSILIVPELCVSHNGYDITQYEYDQEDGAGSLPDYGLIQPAYGEKLSAMNRSASLVASVISPAQAGDSVVSGLRAPKKVA